VMRRAPAVAGTFYSGDEKRLRAEIEGLFLGQLGPGRIPVAPEGRTGSVLGLVSPHAGFVYSGYAAASAFCCLAEDGAPEVAAIIGPNHYGVGAPVAIVEQGIWETPLGDLRIAEEPAARLARACSYVRIDASAHRMEHSLETQTPFLRYIAGDRTSILPIALSLPANSQTRPMIEDLGRALAEALDGVDAVVIASTDMTHYEPKAVAQRKDSLAIQAIEALDSARLIDVVNRQSISMCGAAPAAVAIEACRRMGAVRGELLQYYTSGDITGDTAQVVGYAALGLRR